MLPIRRSRHEGSRFVPCAEMIVRRALLGLALGAPLAGCGLVAPATRTFPVFFEPWSANLDRASREAVDRAAAIARSSPGARVRVVGFADPEGSAAANIELSRLRAQVVMDELMAAGVAPGRILQSARGPTGFAQASQESRRVEITIDGV